MNDNMLCRGVICYVGELCCMVLIWMCCVYSRGNHKPAWDDSRMG